MCQSIRKHIVKDDYMLFYLNRGVKMVNLKNFGINILNNIKRCLNRGEKWELYLYLNGQCVYKMKIDKDFAPMGKFYVIKIKGFKHLIGTNKKTQLVVKSYKYKFTDEIKKQAHIEVMIYEGSDIT